MANRVRRDDRSNRSVALRGARTSAAQAARGLVAAAALVVCFSSAGCSFTPSYWVREDGSMKLDMLSASTSALRVETHNGEVRYDGTKPGNMSAIEIEFTRHGGGSSEADAASALEAISIFAEPREDTLVLGWKWAADRKRGWGGRVDFRVVGTPAMPVEVVSHNGDLTVLGPTRSARAKTHNGDIRVEAAGAAVDAKSHNGDLTLVPGGGALTATTHNGDVSVDLATTQAASGSIETHNGDVRIQTGESTSVLVRFSTRNGGVSGGGTFTKIGKSAWEARYGAAETELRVETYNGDISVR